MGITSKLKKSTRIFLTAALAMALCPIAPAAAYGAEAGTYAAATIAAEATAPLAYKTTTVKKTYGARFTNKLTVNTDGAIKYSSSNRKIATVDSNGKVTAKGVGTVTIKATSAKTSLQAAGSASYKLVVSPRAVALKSLKAAGSGFKAVWAKGNKADVTGYQIKYSKYRDLSSAKTKKVTSVKTASATLKRFAGPANCFAQVRTYAKGKDGKTYYSAWSKKKMVIGSLNSGDKKLDANVNALIKRFGKSDNALKKAFDYVVGKPYASASTTLKGKWTITGAKAMYKNNAGNCYQKAALLAWVAKGLGYNAEAMAGKLVNISSTGEVKSQNPHGWVEVRWNGKRLICDPDTTRTLKTAGVTELRGCSTYLYMVENGKPYTYKK